MKRLTLVLAALALSASLMQAGDGKKKYGKTSFDWSVGFEYFFDNTEYDRSDNIFLPSETIHAVTFSPEVGVVVKQNDAITHSLRVGLDLVRQLGSGEPIREIFDDILIYYNLQAKFRNGGRFDAVFGMFRRDFYAGDYLGVILSVKNAFFDDITEGMLFRYRNEGFYAELGLDWMGMYGDSKYPDRRERFQVLSSGDWRFAGDFHFKWLGSFYHFACSPNQPNVVDNHTVIPSFEWNTDSVLDRLWLNAGGVFTYQYDRNFADAPVMPMGLLSRQGASKWGVSLENLFYWGDDLQPFYNKYGGELYPGEGIFRTSCGKPAVSDRVVLSYSPKIAKWLDLSVSAIFDFGTPIPALNVPAYRGCQQVVNVKFNLEKISLP